MWQSRGTSRVAVPGRSQPATEPSEPNAAAVPHRHGLATVRRMADDSSFGRPHLRVVALALALALTGCARGDEVVEPDERAVGVAESPESSPAPDGGDTAGAATDDATDASGTGPADPAGAEGARTDCDAEPEAVECTALLDPASLPGGTAITTDGMGPVRIGMTVAELRDELGEDYVVTDGIELFGGQFAGSTISRGGHSLLYAIVNGLGDDITDIVTVSTLYATTDGVNVGTLLGDVARVCSPGVEGPCWGQPTLAFHTENEAREFVTFQVGPPNLTVQAAPPGGFHAGIYETQEAGYNETMEFDPSSRITLLWLSCTDCA